MPWIFSHLTWQVYLTGFAVSILVLAGWAGWDWAETKDTRQDGHFFGGRLHNDTGFIIFMSCVLTALAAAWPIIAAGGLLVLPCWLAFLIGKDVYRRRVFFDKVLKRLGKP